MCAGGEPERESEDEDEEEDDDEEDELGREGGCCCCCCCAVRARARRLPLNRDDAADACRRTSRDDEASEDEDGSDGSGARSRLPSGGPAVAVPAVSSESLLSSVTMAARRDDWRASVERDSWDVIEGAKKGGALR
jgi:hypothetical protein